MLLYRILIIIVLLFSNTTITPMDNNILEIMSTAEEIIIYQEGKQIELQTAEDNYKLITDELIRLSTNSRECPAFGVALHNETIEAMQNGLWIEFKFDQTISHNDMPFDSLLIEVVGEYTGFNIIRKYNNKYDGRCFYVDLIDTNLSSLENIIKSN